MGHMVLNHSRDEMLLVGVWWDPQGLGIFKVI